MSHSPAAALQAVGVSKHFGGLPAARDVSFTVHTGEIVGLIGPNGAGKSTVLNCLYGIETPSSGSVLLHGTEMTSWPVHKRARHGVGRTFQLLRLFPQLTVAENVALPLRATIWTRLAGAPKTRSTSKADVVRYTEAALHRVGLESLAAAPVDSLTAGQKRLVEIARLVAMELGVLLLDEPAAGLNASEADELFLVIAELAAEGRAVLLVEHRIRSVVEIVNHLVVMDHGAVIATGDAEQVMSRPEVREAYMGAADHA